MFWMASRQDAAVERGVSKHKAIHSKFRAKLENEFVKKVLVIGENLLSFKEEESEEEDDENIVQPFDYEKN